MTNFFKGKFQGRQRIGFGFFWMQGYVSLYKAAPRHMQLGIDNFQNNRYFLYKGCVCLILAKIDMNMALIVHQQVNGSKFLNMIPFSCDQTMWLKSTGNNHYVQFQCWKRYIEGDNLVLFRAQPCKTACIMQMSKSKFWSKPSQGSLCIGKALSMINSCFEFYKHECIRIA